MKNYTIAFLISLSLCIFGCRANDSSVSNDSIKIAALTEKVDSLSKQLDSKLAKIETQLIKVEKDSEKSKGGFVIAVVSVFVLIAFVSLFLLIKKLAARVNSQKERIKALEDKVFKRADSNKRSSTKIPSLEKILEEINDFDIRIGNIEQKIEVLRNLVAKKEEKVGKNNQEEKPQSSQRGQCKEGYFGMVKGSENGFFNDVYYSKQGECRFKVWFNETETEATFEPINYNLLRSVDGIERAVEYDTDEVSENEASSFEVVKRGKVAKDGANWDIKELAVIKLKK